MPINKRKSITNTICKYVSLGLCLLYTPIHASKCTKIIPFRYQYLNTVLSQRNCSNILQTKNTDLSASAPKSMWYKHGTPPDGVNYDKCTEEKKKHFAARLFKMYQCNYPYQKGKNTFFVFGAVGTGKSTFINGMLNFPLNRNKDGEIEVIKNSLEENPLIGHGSKPTTYGSKLFYNPKMGYICDTEGYGGKRKIINEAEIYVDWYSPFFSLKVNKIKGVIFLMDYHLIGNTKNLDGALEALDALLVHFGTVDLAQLKNAFLLGVTKIDDTDPGTVEAKLLKLIQAVYKNRRKAPADMGHQKKKYFFSLFLEKEVDDKNIENKNSYKLRKGSIAFIKPFKKNDIPGDSSYQYDVSNRLELESLINQLSPIDPKYLYTPEPGELKKVVVFIAQNLYTDLCMYNTDVETLQQHSTILAGTSLEASLASFIENKQQKSEVLAKTIQTLENDDTLTNVFAHEFKRYNPYTKQDVKNEAEDVYKRFVGETLLSKIGAHIASASIHVVRNFQLYKYGCMLEYFRCNKTIIDRIELIADCGEFFYNNKEALEQYYYILKKKPNHLVAVLKKDSPYYSFPEEFEVTYVSGSVKTCDVSVTVQTKKHKLKATEKHISSLMYELEETKKSIKNAIFSKEKSEKLVEELTKKLPNWEKKFKDIQLEDKISFLKCWQTHFLANSAEEIIIKNALDSYEQWQKHQEKNKKPIE